MIRRQRKQREFKLRMGVDDVGRLQALADFYSLPAAAVVRILIKERAERIRETVLACARNKDGDR